MGNESAADVYFDDVSIEHRQGLQVQENQYDPTGLELAGLTHDTPGLKRLNHYKFNGQEFQADLGLNWNHHDWRFFDYQIGRWHVVDPEIENRQESWTPYSFGYDNPVRYEDANGRWPGLPGVDNLISSAGRYVRHRVNEAASNFATSVVSSAKSAVKSLEVSVYGKAETKVSGQVGGSFELKNGLGVNANAKGADILSVTLEGTKNIKTGEFKNNSEISYAGKNGEHKESSGAGAALFIGGNGEKEQTMVGNKTVGTKTTVTASMTPLPILGNIQASAIVENGTPSLRAGYSHGASVGLFLNFSATVEFGFEIKPKSKE